MGREGTGRWEGEGKAGMKEEVGGGGRYGGALFMGHEGLMSCKIVPESSNPQFVPLQLIPCHQRQTSLGPFHIDITQGLHQSWRWEPPGVSFSRDEVEETVVPQKVIYCG